MAIRLPSDPAKIRQLWTGLDATGRGQFLDAAIMRQRIDAIRVALAAAAPVPELDDATYLKLGAIIARADAADVLRQIDAFGGVHAQRLRCLGNTPAYRHLAASAVKHAAVQVLEHVAASGLDPCASDNRYGTSIAHMIAAHGWIQGLHALGRPLPELAAMCDDKKRTLLHTATRYGQPEMVAELIAHGADVNARDSQHRTAFFRCVMGDTDIAGHPERWAEVAVLLMQQGCSLRDRVGKTDRSQTLEDYLAHHGHGSMSSVMATLQARALEDITPQSSGARRPARL